MKRVITDEIVAREFAAGVRRMTFGRRDTVITPAAWSKARELGIGVEQTDAAPAAPTTATATTAPAGDPGSAERSVDKSGVVVVRGRSVRLGKFTGAGVDRDIGLIDLVTGADGSPMTAGIMSFGREDSFPWSLDYDEIDLVLEGVLTIEIDGRKVEGKTGDVLYIPKGSRIVFGTPSRTRVFYVTHPASWASAP